MLDNPDRAFLTRYISDTTTLLYLFCISFKYFVPVFLIMYNPLVWCIRGIESHNWFKSLLYPWFFIIIICGWEILRVVLVRSWLIIHPTESSSGPIYRVAYYLLMHLIVYINDGLYKITSVTSMYKITISVPILFTMYKR